MGPVLPSVAEQRLSGSVGLVLEFERGRYLGAMAIVEIASGLVDAECQERGSLNPSGRTISGLLLGPV